MSFFIVIRKSIKEGYFPTNTKNPSQEELLNNLKSYPKVFLLTTLEDANRVAELFFHAPQAPKVGGSYGLVAEVTATFTDIPQSAQIDGSVIYNNWVDSQHLGYTKNEDSNISYSCIVVSPEQIKSIVNSHIPQSAKTHNPNLQDTDFTTPQSTCSIM
ncbi:MAG: hypothetical protein WC627_07145 [Legionella sp.]|jgi:hypothetical protein